MHELSEEAGGTREEGVRRTHDAANLQLPVEPQENQAPVPVILPNVLHQQMSHVRASIEDDIRASIIEKHGQAKDIRPASSGQSSGTAGAPTRARKEQRTTQRESRTPDHPLANALDAALRHHEAEGKAAREATSGATFRGHPQGKRPDTMIRSVMHREVDR